MKRVAICLSGQLRSVYYTLENTKKYWKKYFEDYDNVVLIDYFIYGSNKLTNGYNVLDVYNIPHCEYITQERINYIKTILNPVIFEIDYDENAVKNYISNFNFESEEVKQYINDSTSHYQYFYSQKCINFKMDYEKNQNINYDITVWHRIDLYFDINNMNPEKIWNDSSFNESIYFSWKYEKCESVCYNDMFSFGNNTLMTDFYKNIYDKILNKMSFFMTIEFVKFTPETWIHYVLPPEIKPAFNIWISFVIFRELLINRYPKYITDNLTYKNINILNDSLYVFAHIFDKISKKYNFNYKVISEILNRVNFNIFDYPVLDNNSEEPLYNRIEYIIENEIHK